MGCGNSKPAADGAASAPKKVVSQNANSPAASPGQAPAAPAHAPPAAPTPAPPPKPEPTGPPPGTGLTCVETNPDKYKVRTTF